MNLRATLGAIALLTAGLLVAPAPALAHAGHAAATSHWHATDTFGLLLVAGAGALAWWFSGGRH
jgi:hypothetical protein